ncbi:MAG: TonB-dependent receptor plug domain-containing protein [Pseudobdellovibrionaceae bacterium]
MKKLGITFFFSVNIVFLLVLHIRIEALAQSIDFDGSTSVNRLKSYEKKSLVQSPSREMFDSEKIKDLGFLSPSEALEDSSQIQVIGSGAFGQTRSVSIRGAPSSYTSIFWNGIKMNDWLSPSANAEANQVGQEFSSQVNISKGPQTLKQSSSAIAGVVEYNYDRDQKYLQISVSDKNIHRESFEYFYQKNQFTTGIGGSFLQSDYASSFDREKLNPRFQDTVLEKDRYQLQSGSLLQAYRWSQAVGFKVIVHRQDSWAADDSEKNDDPNAATSRKNQIYSGVFDFAWEQWATSLRWDHHINSIYYENLPDDIDSSKSVSESDGVSDRLVLSTSKEMRSEAISQNISLGIENSVVQGFFYSDFFAQKTKFDHSISKTEMFGIHEVDYNSTSLFWGVRADGKKTALQAQFQYHFTQGISPYLILGSGYKDASLFQLYSTYGDRSLKNETNRSMEGGFQFRNPQGHELQIGFFRYSFDDLIGYNLASSKYQNTEKAKSEGFEILSTLSEMKVTDGICLRSEFSYQKLQSFNAETKQKTIRIPQDSMKLMIQMNPNEIFSSSITLRHIGHREDIDGPSKKSLPPVNLVHLSSRWKIDDRNDLILRIENAANQPYQEVWGYTPTGRVFLLSYRFSL